MKRLLLLGLAAGVVALGLFVPVASAASPNATLLRAKWWHRKASHHPHVRNYRKPKQHNKHHTEYKV